MRFLRHIAIGLVGGLGLAAAPEIHAQPLEVWKLDTALGINTAATECLGSGYTRRATFLGLADRFALLPPDERDDISNSIAEFLNTRGGLRTSRLPEDGLPPDSEVLVMRALSDTGDSIAFLIDATDREEASLMATVRVWTLEGDALTCDRSFDLVLPVQPEDPNCRKSFDLAQEDPGLAESRLQSFIDFFPNCSQLAAAKLMLAELRAEAEVAQVKTICVDGFKAAEAAGTSAALDAYLATATACSEYTTALWLRDQRRAEEACSAAYSLAATANTAESLGTFLAQHSTCPQTAAAQRQLDALPPPEPEITLEELAAAYVVNLVDTFTRSNREYLALAEVSFADTVYYYGKTLSYDAVLRDKRNFTKRFPERNYRVLEDHLRVSCTAEPVCRVQGRVQFRAVRDTGRVSSGIATFDYDMIPSGDGFRITREVGDVISRN